MPKIPVYLAEEKLPSVARDVETVGKPFRAQIMAEQSMQETLQTAAKGVTRISDQVLRMQAQRLEIDRAMTRIEKTINIQRGLQDISNRYELDQDWQTKPERFKAAANQLVELELQDIKDPLVKQHVRRDVSRVQMHYEALITHQANKQRADQYRAQGLQVLEESERLEAQAPDEIAREKLRAQRIGVIAALTKMGVMTETEAQRINQGLNEKLAANRVLQDMRADPAAVLSRLQKNEYPDLTPEKRESLIGAAQREIERQDRKRDMALKESVARADQEERAYNKAMLEAQRANFARLAAGQTLGKVKLLDIDEALNKRLINEDQYRMLIDRHKQDLRRDIERGEKHLDQMFRSRSPLEALDPTNEQYRARLKREFSDRVKSGEMPDNVLDEIIAREQATPPNPKAVPLPMFFDGRRDDLKVEDVKRAAEKIIQALQDGRLDPNVAERELKKAKTLIDALNYHGSKARPVEEKSGKYIQ